MDYVRSNKDGMKLLFQNNLYVKQKVLSSGAVCWECDQRRNKFACKAYIGRLRPGGHRRALLFDLALWNMYDQTIGDLPSINNAVEGWH